MLFFHRFLESQLSLRQLKCQHVEVSVGHVCSVELSDQLYPGIHAHVPIEHHHGFRESAIGCRTTCLSEHKVGELVQEHRQQSLAQPLCVERQMCVDEVAHPDLMHVWLIDAGIK